VRLEFGRGLAGADEIDDFRERDFFRLNPNVVRKRTGVLLDDPARGVTALAVVFFDVDDRIRFLARLEIGDHRPSTAESPGCRDSYYARGFAMDRGRRYSTKPSTT
jgi:hypothetical protein